MVLRFGHGLLQVAKLFGLLAVSLLPAACHAQLMNTTFTPLRVVTMGDSYVAGIGARDDNGLRRYEYTGDCLRSSFSWTAQYAGCIRTTKERPVVFINNACSGATILNLYEENGKLLNAIGQNTDLVFLSIGIFDSGFQDALEVCYYLRDIEECSSMLSTTEANLPALQTATTTLLSDIRSRARSDTKVVLMSYPYMFLNVTEEIFDDGTDFTNLTSLDIAQSIRQLGDQLDATQRAAVAAANADAGVPAGKEFAIFQDTVKSLFDGHEVHPNRILRNEEGWMHDLDVEDDYFLTDNFVYNGIGHQQLSNHMCFDAGDYGAGLPVVSGAPAGTDNIDLVFVIDTTLSMREDIAAAQAAASEVLDRLASGTQSFQVAVVSYRDFANRTRHAPDYPSRLILDFSNDLTAIQAAIDGLTLGNGGDLPETVWSGIMLAYSLDWRAGVKKLIVQFGDAAPHNPEPFTGYTEEDIIQGSMELDPVVISSVDARNGDPEAEDVLLRRVADATGGEVVRSNSSEFVADGISTVINDTLAAPFAWMGVSYIGYINETVEFDASGSYSTSGGFIVMYEWDVEGDGSYSVTTTEPFYNHTYTSEFVGLAQLRVTDNFTLTALASAFVDMSVDGDGIAADVDNCPLDHNPDQLDTDGNGVGDVCEPEPVLVLDFPPAVAIVTPGISDPIETLPAVTTLLSANVDAPSTGGMVVNTTWFVNSTDCTIRNPSVLNTSISCAEGTYSVLVRVEDSNGNRGSDQALLVAVTPSMAPSSSLSPSIEPSFVPSDSSIPSDVPSMSPSSSTFPSLVPSMGPSSSLTPSVVPSSTPSDSSDVPSMSPSSSPVGLFVRECRAVPTGRMLKQQAVGQRRNLRPRTSPVEKSEWFLGAFRSQDPPTSSPSVATSPPTSGPSLTPSPTLAPSNSPAPSPYPSASPSPPLPSDSPTESPGPSPAPSLAPSQSSQPTGVPTGRPTQFPTYPLGPSLQPTTSPAPSPSPSARPTSPFPSASPSSSPAPSPEPSRITPTALPTRSPGPSGSPTSSPAPSPEPSVSPSVSASSTPSSSPVPSNTPSGSPAPSPNPSNAPSTTLGPTLGSDVPSTTPTVSNEPSKSNLPSVSAAPSISPSQSILPSVSDMPSNVPSLSAVPSITDMPTLTPVPTQTTASRLALSVALQGGAEFADPASYQSQALAFLDNVVLPFLNTGRRRLQMLDWLPYYVLACIYYASSGVPNKYTDAAGVPISGWTNSRNWLTATDKCTWYGVTCNSSGQVTRIELHNNNLIGKVAPEVQLLAPSLDTLNLQDNCYLLAEGAAGNSWIASMENLVFLSVAGTSFEFDGIPTYFNQLSLLGELSRAVFFACCVCVLCVCACVCVTGR